MNVKSLAAGLASVGAALFIHAASAETWDHWEFGSEVSGTWTPGATGANGLGELRDGNWRLVAGLEDNGKGRADCIAVRSPTWGWPSKTGTHTVVLDGTGEVDFSKPVYGADSQRLRIVGIMGYAFHY